LPARREILKLLDYQAHPVAPEANTDEWTKPFLGAEDAARAFRAPGAPGWPRWKVGQWARYRCRDEWLVLSASPERRPHVALVDCAIVGEEAVGDKTYFWYQSVVRLDKYWVAKSTGRYDSGQKVLLETDRKAVLSFLVDGPEFKDVRRYQLKVDDEPLLEYTDGERAVLPRLNIDHALIRPAARTALKMAHAEIQATLNSQAPVTGILSLEYRAPHLDRSATLVNWGEQGARDERAGEKPLVLRLARPPYVAVAFDGFGELRHFQEMVAAGAELFQHQTVLYLGEARRYFNRMPAYFYNVRHWDADPFDLCRSNLLGFSPHLDEPYQRQRKPNEYIKRGEVQTLAEAAERYSAALTQLLKTQRVWPGEEVMDYNSPASAAWYSARVGVSGFVLENARLTQEMADIERVTGKKDARALADEINLACLCGAARRFGVWWGQGIYRWVPERYWRDELVYYAERGARYLGFWIEGGPASKDPQLTYYESVRKALPEIAKTLKSIHVEPRRAKVAIVVPNGYVLGLAGSSPETPWGILDFPQGKRMTDEVIAHAADLFGKGLAFDIVVEDPAYPPALAEYEEVIRVGF